MKDTASGLVGIYLAEPATVCCLCDTNVDGKIVKEIGMQYACIPCVDKALSWMLSKRLEKKEKEQQV